MINEARDLYMRLSQEIDNEHRNHKITRMRYFLLDKLRQKSAIRYFRRVEKFGQEVKDNE